MVYKKWTKISVPVEFAEIIELESKRRNIPKKQILLNISDKLFYTTSKKRGELNVKSNRKNGIRLP